MNKVYRGQQAKSKELKNFLALKMHKKCTTDVFRGQKATRRYTANAFRCKKHKVK